MVVLCEGIFRHRALGRNQAETCPPVRPFARNAGMDDQEKCDAQRNPRPSLEPRDWGTCPSSLYSVQSRRAATERTLLVFVRACWAGVGSATTEAKARIAGKRSRSQRLKALVARLEVCALPRSVGTRRSAFPRRRVAHRKGRSPN